MFKAASKFAAASALTAMIAAPASAGIEFSAEFLEQWFTVGGQANSDVDTEGDLFGFALEQVGNGIYDVEIVGIAVNFDSAPNPIELDESEFFLTSGFGVGLSGFEFFYDFETPDLTEFQLANFIDGFDVGDALAFELDVDDENAVVRGTNGSASFSDFAGSTVEVFYTDVGRDRSAVFTYGACDPASPDDCSAAGGSLAATNVPSPATPALIGLGLVALAGLRRRK